MEVEQIKIGNDVMVRYKISAPAPNKKNSSVDIKPQLRKKDLSLEDYATIYSKEDLYQIDGQKYPFVLMSSTRDLSTQTAELMPRSYQIPQELLEFRQGVLKYKLRPGNTDGNCARVIDFETDGERTHARLQHTGYFDHMATDLAKDVYLDQFCEVFGQGKTLRDLEVNQGVTKQFSKSRLVNLLAFPFIMISQEQGKDYVVLSQRGKDLAVEAGDFSILGGTSEWKQIIKLGGDNWQHYFKSIADKEMGEELCLNPTEFEIEKISWWQAFTRAPNVVICMRTNIPIEQMIKRIEQNPEAQKEHSAIYKVPVNPETIKVIREDKKFNLNDISKVCLDWHLRN